MRKSLEKEEEGRHHLERGGGEREGGRPDIS